MHEFFHVLKLTVVGFYDEEPVPSTFWSHGVEPFQATSSPHSCYQRKKGNEDCLYLSVYVPAESNSKRPLEVIVNIHGGGFQHGYGDMNGPEYLLDKEDIILVSFNYRLGVLGFLSLEDKVLPGNLGLKDQNLALKWIKNNIAAFGGDADKITILGHSAGGVCAHFHTLSPLSKGLFQRAVIMSGTALNPWAVTNNAREKALRIAETVGCSKNSSKAIVECLRRVPAKVLTESSDMFKIFGKHDFKAISPVIESPSPTAFLYKNPLEIIHSGEYSDVPMLFSYTNDEMITFSAAIFTNASAATYLDKNWNDLLPVMLYYKVEEDHKEEVATKIRKFYLKDKKSIDAPKELSVMFNERYLEIGIRQAAMLHAAKNKSPIYAFVFSHTGGIRASDLAFPNHTKIYQGGAVHGDDLYYVFKTAGYERIFPNAPKEEEKMSTYLTQLMRDFTKKSPPASWQTVKSGLPNFTYLDIPSPEVSTISVKTFRDFTADRFWDSLKIQDYPRKHESNRQVEL